MSNFKKITLRCGMTLWWHSWSIECDLYIERHRKCLQLRWESPFGFQTTLNMQFRVTFLIFIVNLSVGMCVHHTHTHTN